MARFNDDVRKNIQDRFLYGEVPDEEDFAAFIQAIADGIEWHKHVPGGGPGSGTGDAAPILPDLEPDAVISDTAIDNIDTWRKLLASHPYLATEGLPKTWPDNEANLHCQAVTCDPPHMYAGFYTFPAKVVKINISDMTVLQTWIGEQGEGCCRALLFDGSFLYAGLNTYPARVIKIAPAAMNTIATWVGESGMIGCQALTCDGPYLYAGLRTDPARVVKIYTDTMHTHDVWETAPGWACCRALTFDGKFIYAGLWTDPAKVIKIDPATMETVAVWVGNETQERVSALAFDCTYIYAGLSTEPAQVVKINPFTMTEVDCWIGESWEDYCQALIFDGELIHAVTHEWPTRLITIDLTTMQAIRSKRMEATGSSDERCRAITFDGLRLGLGFYEPIEVPHVFYYVTSDPQTGQLVYLIEGDGDPLGEDWVHTPSEGHNVYLSQDGGLTWDLLPEKMDKISVTTPSGSVIHACRERDGVYKSTDLGATWEKIYTFYRYYGQYATTSRWNGWDITPGWGSIQDYWGQFWDPFTGVYFRWGVPSDGGFRKVRLNKQQIYSYSSRCLALAVSPLGDSPYAIAVSAMWGYTGIRYTCHKFSIGAFTPNGSPDGWSLTPKFGITTKEGHPKPYTQNPAQIDWVGSTVIVVSDNYLFKSTDNGETWEELDAQTKTASIHPSNSDVWLRAMPSGEIQKTLDGGTTWVTKDIVEGGTPKWLDWKHPDIVYLATTNGYYKSTDGGETWQHFPTLPGYCLPSE